MDEYGGDAANGRNSGVGRAFNRAEVFSATECNALIELAETAQFTELEEINDGQIFLGGQPFIRRHQILPLPETRNPGVIQFERKLCEWIAALNEQIWHFHVTQITRLALLKYRSGDEVGLHFDLGKEYSDRKLAALVQLSPVAAYSGGAIGFGLPVQPASAEQGSLLVLPSWVPHRVMPIISGVRYTALCFALGPSFR